MVRPVTADDTGLKVLCEPTTNDGSTSTSPSTIDIVAIHGIGAHPDDTWCKNVGVDQEGRPRYVNWLKDKHMLPSIVPHARIMRYGYESQWFGPNAIRQKVSTAADRFLLALMRERERCQCRPLLFVAHCFGGLVVLKALLEAKSQRKKWPGIFPATAGLIFFGTPFRGAEGMSHSEMIQAAYREYKPEQVQEQVLQILEPGNEFLHDLVDKFGETRAKKHKAPIACFFELKPSDVGAIVGGKVRLRFVVSQSSGCLDLSRSTEKYSLARSHFDMNKFGKLTEEDFQTVCGVIKRMAKMESELLLARSKHHSKHKVPFSLPGLPLVNRFVGRDAEMLHLKECFLPETPSPTRRKVFVIHGLGGMGKTQLAIEFARKHHRRYSAVFWLDGSSRDRLQQSFTDIASRLPRDQLPADAAEASRHANIDVRKAVNGTLQWLSLPSNHNWLLIIDNVDRCHLSKDKDPQAYDVNDFFPSAEHGSILITSRLAGLHRKGESQKLDTVDAKQARAILENNAGRLIKDVDLIIKELNGLPLALTQAGAYLGQTNMTASDYVKHYHSTWKDLMKKQDRFPLQEYADRGVLTTWIISYEKVRAQSEAAAGLLKLWGFLDCRDLWYELVATANSLDRSIKVPDWLPRLVQTRLQFLEALQILSHYSLIDAKGQASGHLIHSVLHEWCYQLAEGNERRMLFRLAASIVAWRVPEESELEHRKLLTRLLPHGTRVARVADDERFEQSRHPKELSLAAWAFFRLGMLFGRGFKLNEAKKMYMRAKSRYSSVLGPEHKLTLDTMVRLGDIDWQQGQLNEAADKYERALANFETVFESIHTSTVRTIRKLAELYWGQNKWDEAEKTYQRAILKFETVFGPKDWTTLSTIRDLGRLYWEQNKLDEAKEMYRRALTGYEMTLRPEHTAISGTRHCLDKVCRKQNKPDEEIVVNRSDYFERYPRRVPGRPRTDMQAFKSRQADLKGHGQARSS